MLKKWVENLISWTHLQKILLILLKTSLISLPMPSPPAQPSPNKNLHTHSPLLEQAFPVFQPTIWQRKSGPMLKPSKTSKKRENANCMKNKTKRQPRKKKSAASPRKRCSSGTSRKPRKRLKEQLQMWKRKRRIGHRSRRKRTRTIPGREWRAIASWMPTSTSAARTSPESDRAWLPERRT